MGFRAFSAAVEVGTEVVEPMRQLSGWYCPLKSRLMLPSQGVVKAEPAKLDKKPAGHKARSRKPPPNRQPLLA